MEVDYTYDSYGNLLSEADGTTEITYTYDLANRLISYDDGNNTYSYQYDGSGQRLSKTVNGVTISYVNDSTKANEEVLSYTKADTTVNYTYGNQRISSEGIGYIYDSYQNVVIHGSENYQYTPYGELLSGIIDGDNEYGYKGEVHDTAQLQYLRARYYNTRLAQFISEDSYTGTDDNPLSQNRYTFAADNPFKYRDPSGHRIASVIDELSGGSKTTTKPQGSGSTGASVTGSIKKITDTATTAVSGISSNTYKPSDPKLILTDPIAAIAEVNDFIARSGVNKAEVKESLAKENSLVETMKMFGVGKPIVNSSKTPFATVINKLMADNMARKGTGNVVTAQQLKDFGWADTSDEFVERLNEGLIRYGITDKNSIAFFMATMAEESGWGKYSYEIRSDFSKSSYNSNDRGAGYIQITHRETHLAFLKSMGDDFSGADTATYISENYALESALWFWISEKAKSTSVGSLNDYVETYGSGKGVFLITQYYVNGWPSGNNTNTNLVYIRNGGSFDESSGRLNVNGESYRLPRNWDNRSASYDKAINVWGK